MRCDIHSLIIWRYFFLIIGRQFCNIESFQIKDTSTIKYCIGFSELLYFAGNEKRNSKYSSVARSDLISQRHAGTLSWDQMGPTFKRHILCILSGTEENYIHTLCIILLAQLDTYILSWLSCGNKTITDCLLLCHAWQSVQCHQASSGVRQDGKWPIRGQPGSGPANEMAAWKMPWQFEDLWQVSGECWQ